MSEYAPDKRRGFFASFLDMGSYLGFALGAALVSVLQLTLGQDSHGGSGAGASRSSSPARSA